VIRAVATLAAAGVAVFAVGLLVGLAVVGRRGGGPIQGWDDRVQVWGIHHRFGLTGAAKVVAYLGDAPKLAVVAVVLTGVLLLTTHSIRALVPAVAYLGAEFQVFLIRAVVNRPRPPTSNYPAPGAVPGVHETSSSFPSGHSVAVTAILFGLAGSVALARRLWWPWVVALAASVFVVDTRLVLGVHWFSDVLFGLVLGIGWGVTVAFVFRDLEWEDLRAWVPGRREPVTVAAADSVGDGR
jgi:membrane-associated phospholipid phosphatase